jgi:hypothetical protein
MIPNEKLNKNSNKKDAIRDNSFESPQNTKKKSKKINHRKNEKSPIVNINNHSDEQSNKPLKIK